MDVSNLPPAAKVRIDFARDIKPILEANCLRCHGPEKPKSEFRLDNLQGALKGGDDGVAIVPGDSAKSPLIHYVSYQVADMEMPPIGSGNRLTTNEVSLLRAWIDQGVNWNTDLLTNNFDFSFTPMAGGSVVSGNQSEFREQNWQPDGFIGGAERFQLFQQTSPDTRLQIDGHVLPFNYNLSGSLDRNDLGFIHAGWQQFRKYYDDTGGFDPNLLPTAPSLGEDLHLDVGKAWVDFGLTLPDWPELVLGYEYDYRIGNEALTEWGAVGTDFSTSRNIAPASESINESVNILKFNLNHTVAGVSIQDQFRGEFYNLKTSTTNTEFGPISYSINQGTSWFQGANTVRLEKKFNDWLLGSAGYLYSKLNADSYFTMDEPGLQQNVSIPQITLERESHVGNLNAQLGPFDGLTISSGLQAEWTRQSGFGTGTLDEEMTPPPDFIVAFDEASDYDESSLQENLSLRYTKIPFTTLYAEARTEQEDMGQDDQFAAPEDILNKAVFQQHTAFTSQTSDWRFGFSSSPWRLAAFSAQFRRYEDDSQYDSDPLLQPVPTAYPTFLRSRQLITDEVETKLVLYLNSRVKTILSYRYQDDGYDVNTEPYAQFGNVISPGGELMAGRDDSHIFSINTTFTPTPRLYLSTMFSYQISSATTMANGSPAVAPYRGDIYTVLADGTYVLSQNTDLFAGYYFSEANYGQNNLAGGLPLGLVYRENNVQVGVGRRLGRNASAKLQYRYSCYNEPGGGGANNYHASSIFGSITFQLP